MPQVWHQLWGSAAFRESIVLSRLMELCPDLDSRVQLWTVIRAEYGNAAKTDPHSILLRRFLLALGASEAELATQPQRNVARVRDELHRIDSMSFHELLAYGLLGPASVAYMIFSLIEGLLSAPPFEFDQDELTYFTTVAEHAQPSAQVALSLLARYADTTDKQRSVRKALYMFFLSHPLADVNTATSARAWRHAS